MTRRPTILCPIDYSDASRRAIHYARVIAEHFGARLLLLAVEDPLLTEAVDLGTGVVWDPQESRRELEQFARAALGEQPLRSSELALEVAVGKPAPEILRVARAEGCELIVMSTHGLTGMRKLFFGSTTERVLRETTVPVLLTPANDHGPTKPEDVKKAVKRILIPVDLSPATLDQVRTSGKIAAALDVPVLLAHVVEPLRFAVSGLPHLPNLEVERRFRAERSLSELSACVGTNIKTEALVAYGDPAEEIAKVARDRDTGLIVIGLHASSMLGPRMGSVTYRVLCLTSTLVLALPPKQ
jgi:universal stress protein A